LLTELLLIVIWIATTALAIPLITFCIEVTLGLRPNKVFEPNVAPYNACIIMPAHNEVEVLGETLDQLLSVLPEGVSVLVVADNCADQTADIARTHAVTVIEREEPSKRGKGHALAFGQPRQGHRHPRQDRHAVGRQGRGRCDLERHAVLLLRTRRPGVCRWRAAVRPRGEEVS